MRSHGTFATDVDGLPPSHGPALGNQSHSPERLLRMSIRMRDRVMDRDALTLHGSRLSDYSFVPPRNSTLLQNNCGLRGRPAESRNPEWVSSFASDPCRRSQSSCCVATKDGFHRPAVERLRGHGKDGANTEASYDDSICFSLRSRHGVWLVCRVEDCPECSRIVHGWAARYMIAGQFRDLGPREANISGDFPRDRI